MLSAERDDLSSPIGSMEAPRLKPSDFVVGDPTRVADFVIPVTIAVTGHRDPADAHRLQEAVGEVLDLIAARFPHTPLQALSSLAEGADRAFAAAALARGLALDVVLPLPPSDYERDFPGTSDEFRALLAKARQVGTMPWVTGVDAGSAARPGLARNLQYAQTGLHMASRAQILIAAWDGQPARGLGGTAQIVSARRDIRLLNEQGEGIEHLDRLLEASLIDQPQVGIVCWLPTRRRDQPSAPGTPDVQAPRWAFSDSEWMPTLPDDLRDSALQHLRELDAYNARLREYLAAPQALAAIGATWRAASTSKVSPIVGSLYARFLAADALANTGMNHARKQVRNIFVLGAALATVFETWAHVLGAWYWLAFYLGLMSLIGLKVRHLQRTEANEHAVDWRVLAEGLRVQTFWLAGGIVEPVSKHYLRRHGPALQWVRTALSGVVPVWPDPSAGALSEVMNAWLEHQLGYFKNSVLRRRAVVGRIQKVSKWAYRAAAALALLVLAAMLGNVDGLGGGESPTRAWLVVTLGLLPAWSGLLVGYLEFAGYRDDVREHQRMHELFDTAGALYRTMLPHAEATARYGAQLRGILRDLGIEALREQADWALLHKSHELEMPKA